MFGDIGGGPPPPSGPAGEVTPVTGGSRGIGEATRHARTTNGNAVNGRGLAVNKAGAGGAVSGRRRAATGDGGGRGDAGRAVPSLASNASPRGAEVTLGLAGGRVIV
ncbi:hypothetical protein [Streptosporangium sp. NPDC006007]|uniref:hypothetical protein n=1 Tax=Streptosporangium sp. NPDC006007 TaxID=3154575 RepID=UPI0033BA174F